MTPSESLFFDVRGLRYHVRAWGPRDAPPLFLLHGWMDVSASFQFLVDCLRGRRRVLAPDWRGYGLTAAAARTATGSPTTSRISTACSICCRPTRPRTSRGTAWAATSRASMPARARRALPHSSTSKASACRPPSRATRRRATRAGWTNCTTRPACATTPTSPNWPTRLRKQNPRLTPERAEFLAQHWGGMTGGRVVLRGDPAHKIVNPVQYQLEEAKACWRAITAPVLWVQGAATQTLRQIGLTDADVAERKACFTRLTECVIPDAGHMLHHDQPERLAAEIERFLDGLAGERGVHPDDKIGVMKYRNVDLHCHSTVSDGTLAPEAVVRRAAANGVDLLALTDHDETGGLDAARAAADAAGIALMPGVEVSVSWGRTTIHIVGVGIDAAHEGLAAGLQPHTRRAARFARRRSPRNSQRRASRGRSKAHSRMSTIRNSSAARISRASWWRRAMRATSMRCSSATSRAACRATCRTSGPNSPRRSRGSAHPAGAPWSPIPAATT